MSERACDLGAVAGRIIEAAQGGSALVAVSGFAGSDTEGLANQLVTRLDGASLLRMDLLELSPSEMTATWAEGTRARLVGHSRPATIVLVEGRGLLHPGLVRAFQTSVWLDIDIEDAVMAERLRNYLSARAAGGPPGRWFAHRPSNADDRRVDVDAQDAEFFARFRPDRVASVRYVPIGGMKSPVRIRCFAEIGCDFVLWDDENAYLGMLEHLLPIPGDLRARLLRLSQLWGRYEGTPARGEWPGSAEAERQVRSLADELQAALGPEYTVRA